MTTSEPRTPHDDTPRENRRLGQRILDRQLAAHEYVAGDYSIADMAAYPWIVPYKNQSQNIDDFPHLKRWLEAIRALGALGGAIALDRATALVALDRRRIVVTGVVLLLAGSVWASHLAADKLEAARA